MITDANYLATILAKIPHADPFRFVDGLHGVSDTAASGYYTFPIEAAFYKGHFPAYPVTPGVILTECMVQCSMLPLAIHLMQTTAHPDALQLPLLTYTNVEFRKEVLPGEQVVVQATLIYFRRGIIKCGCEMYNATGDTVSLGELTAVAKK